MNNEDLFAAFFDDIENCRILSSFGWSGINYRKRFFEWLFQ